MTEAQIAALVVLGFLAWIAWEIGKRTSPSRNLRKIQRIAEANRLEKSKRAKIGVGETKVPQHLHPQLGATQKLATGTSILAQQSSDDVRSFQEPQGNKIQIQKEQPLHAKKSETSYALEPEVLFELKTVQTQGKYHINIYEGSSAPAVELQIDSEASRGQERNVGDLNKFSEHQLYVIDGSNVMFWQDGSPPDLNNVRLVIEKIKPFCKNILVVFDPSYRHKVSMPEITADELSEILGVEKNFITIAPAGAAADDLILQIANERRGVVVTNDRYSQYPRYSDIPLSKGKIVMDSAYLYPPA